jgi:hypothetical protein
MDLHSENSSPNTTTMADTKFLLLPLELRLMIYDSAIEYESELPLGYFPEHRSESMKAVVQLSSISRQILDEVHDWLADKTCFVPLVVTKTHHAVPHTALCKHRAAFKKGPGEWKDFNLDAPRSFKFWGLALFLPIKHSAFISLGINFQNKKVCVEGTKAKLGRAAMASFKEGEELSSDAMQTSKEALTTAMQTVVDQEGFDGFTFGDMHLLLRNLKVSDPEPSGDYVVYVEDAADTPSVQTGGKE